MKNNSITKAEKNTAIRRLRSRGLKYVEIADRLNISHGTVSNVLNENAIDNTYRNLDHRNRKIKKLSKMGYDRNYIAEMFDLNPSTISQIVRGSHGYSEKSKASRRKTRKTQTKAKKTQTKTTKTRAKTTTTKKQVTTYSILWGMFTYTKTT